MKWSVTGCAAVALFAAAVAPTAAEAAGKRAWAAGVIGGMSANEILGLDPYYGYGAYPGYPASAYYAAPAGPPPGCVIRQQKVWSGYGWRWRKLRICH